MKETKVVCPKCGAEMAIPEHESFAVGVAIGKDSGLGTVTLPLASENNSNPSQADEINLFIQHSINYASDCYFSVAGIRTRSYGTRANPLTTSVPIK